MVPTQVFIVKEQVYLLNRRWVVNFQTLFNNDHRQRAQTFVQSIITDKEARDLCVELFYALLPVLTLQCELAGRQRSMHSRIETRREKRLEAMNRAMKKILKEIGGEKAE